MVTLQTHVLIRGIEIIHAKEIREGDAIWVYILPSTDKVGDDGTQERTRGGQLSGFVGIILNKTKHTFSSRIKFELAYITEVETKYLWEVGWPAIAPPNAAGVRLPASLSDENIRVCPWKYTMDVEKNADVLRIQGLQYDLSAVVIGGIVRGNSAGVATLVTLSNAQEVR